MRSLLKTFGADESDIQRVNLELMREEELNSLHRRTVERAENVVIDWPDAQLPPSSKSILDLVSIDSKVEAALQYIAARKLDTLADWHYSDFWTLSKIELYYHLHTRARVVGSTARWVGETPNKETPKYYMSMPKDFVFNMDAQKDRHYVIVTEGQFDALVTGGVAVGGNACSRRQADIIDSLNKEVIVLPDFDVAGRGLVKTCS